MADLTVWKYHGTGNDFVMLEDLDDERPLTSSLVAALCDRRFGVGADGVIRVTRGGPGDGDFFMDYWNADGKWLSGAELPADSRAYVRSGGVAIELDTEHPYERNEYVIAHYRNRH